MFLGKDSFTVVLLGDWNKLYIQPDWISENVYEAPEIEIGVNGQGSDFSVSYKCNNIIISPTQSQVLFTALNVSESTIDYAVKCINNFLEKANTPFLMAYGFNCDYFDSDGSQFADVIDAMSDNSAIIDCGYQIRAAKVSRTLVKSGKILNVDFSLEGTNLKIHFNEHHGDLLTTMPVLEVQQVQDFLRSCNDIAVALGYEIEEDE